ASWAIAQLFATALSASVTTFVAAVALPVARATAAVANSENDSVAMKFASSAAAKANAFQVAQWATAWMDSGRSLRLSAVAPTATIPIAEADARASRWRALEGRTALVAALRGCLPVLGRVITFGLAICLSPQVGG